MWRKYGFASESLFAYSVPLRVKVDSPCFELRCDGAQQVLTAKKGGNVKIGDGLITIGSLIVGCMSRGVPLSGLRSMLKILSLSEVSISKLLREIQEINLNVRMSIMASLGATRLDGNSALQHALKYETELIQDSM